MNETIPTSALDVQVSALLQRVEGTTQQRCNQIRAAAESQVREILRSARTEARENVRKAVAQERSRMEQGLRRAQARAELETRQHAQREIQSLLEHLWKEIPSILEARWKDPATRRNWIEAAITQAAIVLGARPWRVEHGKDWAGMERSEFEDRTRQCGSTAIDWVLDSTLAAGFSIRSEGACLAATVAGLLARRDDVESAFLADYLSLQRGSVPGVSGTTRQSTRGDAPETHRS